MISITCTQCRTVLTIDEAFAGGVCRCQHCGTIQTVPKAAAAGSSSFSPAPTASKSLYQTKSGARNAGGNVATTGPTSSSGLDDLAAVVSSGLSGSGLRGTGSGAGSGAFLPPTPQAQLAPQANAPGKGEVKKKFPVIPAAIGGGVVVAGIVFFFFARSFFGSGGGTPGAGGGAGGPVNGTFAGIPISGPSVVYVIDRGNNIRKGFPDVKAATVESVKSLGTDGKFAIIMWNNESPEFAFPSNGFLNATTVEVGHVEKELDGVQATGASSMHDALERAMARKPASIILITGKPRLEADDEAALSSAKQAGTSIKFYAFAIDVDNASLKLAAGSNFQYSMMRAGELVKN
jgi:hypothetical protein